MVNGHLSYLYRTWVLVFLYCSVAVSVTMEKLSEGLIMTVMIMFLFLLPVDSRFMREARDRSRLSRIELK